MVHNLFVSPFSWILGQILSQKKIHQNSTFWPDLAPCLYSNENQEWLKENTLTFVPKLHNPPSVLQIRPIEVFWSILKQKVYSGDWSA